MLLTNVAVANNVTAISKAHPEYLIFAVPSQFDRLDPTLSMDAQTKNALQLIFEPLVQLNNKQEIVPVLAQDWFLNNKENLIVIHINENHFFSDGTKITANDIVNSILRMCKVESKSSTDLHGLLGCETGSPQIKAIDNYHIRLKLNENPSVFLFQLTSPRVVITRRSSNGLIGSGPYKIAQRTDDYLVLAKNPLYWNANFVKNSGLILFRLQENKINEWLNQSHLDGTIMYSISRIMKFNNKNFILKNEPPMTTEILVFNNQRFPFNKKIVRQAIISELYNDNKISHCMNGIDRAYGVIPPGIGGSIANLSPPTMQEIKPEEIFEAVPELKNHIISVTIHRHSALKNDCEDEALISAAIKYHINVNVKYHDNYASLWPLYLNHQLDGFVEFFDIKSREGYSIFQVFMAKSPENYSNIIDHKLDGMIEQALTMQNSHDRFQQYRKINQYLLSEGYIDPYYYIGHSNIWNICLEGLNNSFYFNPYQHLPELSRQSGCKN